MSHHHPHLSLRLSRAHRFGITAAAVLTAGALALPAAASAKTGSLTDPVGDGTSPGRDITQIDVEYKPKGRLKVILTTAGPLDKLEEDAVLTIYMRPGKCTGDVTLIAYSTIDDVDPPLAYTLLKGKKKKKKWGPKVVGRSEITGNNTLEVTYSGKNLKNVSPYCFAADLSEVTTNNKVGKIYDETEITVFD